jgi:GPH family glycoside/pentoside/hexuronide:cation symporter
MKSEIKQSDAEIKDSEIIPMSTKIIYTLPAFGKMSCLVLMNIQALMYYESIGAGLLYLSFFVALARAVEVIIKPAIAHWSDELKSPLGRRKPFMLFGCIFYAVFLILLFVPPGMRMGGFYISMWFGCFYVLFFIADTVTNVPYLALGPELSSDTKEREILYIFFYTFQYIGVLFASALPVVLDRLYPSCNCDLCHNPLVTHFQECLRQCDIICDLKKNRDSLFYMSLFIGIFYVITIFLLCIKIKENKKSFNTEKVHFLPSLQRLSNNRPFVLLVVPWIIDTMITTTFATMLPFFLNFVINPQNYCIKNGIDLNLDRCSVNVLIGYSISSFFIFCIFSMFVWHYLVGIYGKKRCWQLYSLIAIPAFSLFLMCDEGSFLMLIIASIGVAIPAGGAYLNDVFISDLIEYDEFLTGKRTEGLFTVFAAYIPKVVSIFSQSIPLAAMSCNL